MKFVFSGSCCPPRWLLPDQCVRQPESDPEPGRGGAGGGLPDAGGPGGAEGVEQQAEPGSPETKGEPAEPGGNRTLGSWWMF